MKDLPFSAWDEDALRREMLKSAPGGKLPPSIGIGSKSVAFRDIRSTQRERILEALADGRWMARDDLAEVAGTCGSTVSNLLSHMKVRGLVTNLDERGRMRKGLWRAVQ